MRTGGADNQSHAVRHIQLADNGLKLFAVCAIADFARNAAATGGIGHQHAIASGQGQISGQRSAFIATLFFHHLHQNDLAALDDFLDFVFAVQSAGIDRPGGFLMRIAADIGNRFAVFFRALLAGFGGRFGFFLGVTLGAVFGGLFFQQLLAVTDRDLIIIGVDFAKRQKAVPIAAIFNKCGLQRRLYTGNFSEVNIAAQRRF